MDLSAAFFIALAVLWIVVIFQSLVLLGLVRIVHRLQSTAGEQTSPEGEPAATFASIDVAGQPFASSSLNGRMRALLFVSADCRSCMTTLEELQALELKSEGAFVVICRGNAEECARLAETHKLSVPVILDEDRTISGLYKIDAVPTAVLVSPDDRIQSHGSPLRDELEQIARTVGSSEQTG